MRGQNAQFIGQTLANDHSTVDRVRDLPDDETLTARLATRRRAIGDRVRAERKRQQQTQDAVWMAARISRWTYQRVESGEEVTLSTLLRIAWVLGTPLADLVADE